MSTNRIASLGERLLRASGTQMLDDFFERPAARLLAPPAWTIPRHRRRLAAIERAGALFIHIPKNAGMSISRALYGEQIYHPSIRYYLRFAPKRVRRLPSFAIWRDPVERFVSAFRFARAGGNPANRVSMAFRTSYMAFETLDDALDHVEAAHSVYDLDHIFRPQFWYVADWAGRIAVDHLFRFDQMDSIGAVMGLPQIEHVPEINASVGAREAPTAAQIARMRRLYAIDFSIDEGLASGACPSDVAARRWGGR
jgi:hypothetical protein